MTITFFKSRCLVCWKGFEVPLLSDISYRDDLYYDKTAKTFYYFSWFNNKKIENCVKDFLSKKPELQFLNDDTKGNTARHIVGIMANGNKECVLGYNRCPRCGLKFNLVSDTKTGIKEIEQLSFTAFLKLDNNERHQYLLDKTKNG